MQLFAGPYPEFSRETQRNTIATRLEHEFEKVYGRPPSTEEARSWRNSLGKIRDVFEEALLEDNGVILEFQLPFYSGRLDCLVTGQSPTGIDSGLIVELKQWETVRPTEGENEVETWIGGENRDVLHPSVQVSRYKEYLKDLHSAFSGEGAPSLSSCVYLHNYRRERAEPLLDSKFSAFLADSPVYLSDQFDALVGRCRSLVGGGDGLPLLERIEAGKEIATRAFLDHVASAIRGTPDFHLLDEQQVAHDTVMSHVRRATEAPGKSAIIVEGGPGSGKSLIAINLLATLAGGTEGRARYLAHYVTGSRAFTRTLRTKLGPRMERLFKWTNSYSEAEADGVPVLLVDEAHRIRPVTTNRFGRPTRPNPPPQVEEILRAGRVSVFFIDDLQTVTPTDAGSTTGIRAAAERLGIPVRSIRLEGQFRCGGSGGFVQWVESVLGLRQGPVVRWENTDLFEFRIVDSPEELDTLVRTKAGEGRSARLVAGFCWPWSKARKDGVLPEDVRIGSFARPWNAREEATHLPKGIPKASLWAYSPGGLNQIGCVYTAQGFEFDYVGVIFGNDLQYDVEAGGWTGHPERNYDPMVKRSGERFLELVKRTYRVLLTRGIRGCFVHFIDPDTRDYVRSRISEPMGSSEA
jgi:hypothetical protein